MKSEYYDAILKDQNQNQKKKPQPPFCSFEKAHGIAVIFDKSWVDFQRTGEENDSHVHNLCLI